MRTNKRVSAIIIKENNILLVHRKKKGDEYWVVIGGGMEEAENLEEALMREVLEETGLALVDYKFLGNKSDSLDHEHYFYSCKVSGGNPTLGGPEKEENCEENWYNLEWVEIEKIGDLKNLYPLEVKEFLINI